VAAVPQGSLPAGWLKLHSLQQESKLLMYRGNLQKVGALRVGAPASKIREQRKHGNNEAERIALLSSAPCRLLLLFSIQCDKWLHA
jgi:hypothetical protein